MLNKEEKSFWIMLLKKTFSMFGFVFFSTITTAGLFEMISLKIVFSSAFVGAGGYFFLELMKYYKIDTTKVVNTKSQTKLYNFII